jgi:hypothetical protein
MKITPWIRFWIVFAIALFLMFIFWTFFLGIALIATVFIIILGIIIGVLGFIKKNMM